MRAGIIGNGNIGSALAKCFNRNGVYEFNISDVDSKKSSMKNEENIRDSDILFLCVKDKDVENFLSNSNLTGKILVSTSSTLVSNMKKFTTATVIRIVPNLAMEYVPTVIPYYVEYSDDMSKLKQFFQKEKLFKVNNEAALSTYASINPGILAYLAREYIRIGTEQGLSNYEATSFYFQNLENFLELSKNHSLNQIVFHSDILSTVKHMDTLEFPKLIRESYKKS